VFAPGIFQGHRILITGGGTGLGREMAAKFLALGADLYICGRRKGVVDQTAVELMAEHGGSVKAYQVDIKDAQAVDTMIQWIWDDGGPLTGLVNNAAGNFISRTEDLSPRGFDAIAGIVLHGTFYTTHAVGKRWIAGGHKGSVLSIVVTWVWTGSPFVVPSAMSKAGVHVMTQSLAVEWGRYGIRLNGWHPIKTTPLNRPGPTRWGGTGRCRSSRTWRRS
jgi:NAD(P)-dependent dehydrogenase (short-subunit alcohol dehydrogenase family)